MKNTAASIGPLIPLPVVLASIVLEYSRRKILAFISDERQLQIIDTLSKESLSLVIGQVAVNEMVLVREIQAAIVLCNNYSLIFFDLTSGSVLKPWSTDMGTGWIRGIRVWESTDGPARLVLTDYEGRFWVRSAKNGELILQFQTVCRGTFFAWQIAGQHALIWDSSGIEIWDLSTGTQSGCFRPNVSSWWHYAKTSDAAGALTLVFSRFAGLVRMIESRCLTLKSGKIVADVTSTHSISGTFTSTVMIRDSPLTWYQLAGDPGDEFHHRVSSIGVWAGNHNADFAYVRKGSEILELKLHGNQATIERVIATTFSSDLHVMELDL